MLIHKNDIGIDQRGAVSGCAKKKIGRKRPAGPQGGERCWWGEQLSGVERSGVGAGVRGAANRRERFRGTRNEGLK